MATSTISTGSYRPGDAQNAWPLWTAVQHGAPANPGYVTTPPGNWLTPTRAIMSAGDLIGVKAACSERCGTLSVEFSLNNGAPLTVSNPTIQTDQWGTTEAYWFKLPAGLSNGLHEIRARIKPSISGNERLLQSTAGTSLVSYSDQSTHSLLIAVDNRNYYAQVAVGGTATGSNGVGQGTTPNAALPKYDSIAAAHSALLAAMGGSSTAGATIYLGAGDWRVTTAYTPDDAYWLTIKGAPGVARADIRISVPHHDSGGDPNIFNGYLKVQGVTLSQHSQYSLFYKPGSGANKLIWLDDFVYQGRGTTVGGGGLIANSTGISHPVTRGEMREVRGGHAQSMATGFIRNVDYYRNTGDLFTGVNFIVNSVVTECRGLGNNYTGPNDTEHADVYQNMGGISNIILCNIQASSVKLAGDVGVAAMQQVEGAGGLEYVRRSQNCLFQNISLSGFEGNVGFMGGDPIGVLIRHCSFSNWFDLDARTTTNGLSPTVGDSAGTYRGCEIVNSIFYDMHYGVESQSLVSKLKAVGAYRGNHLIAGSRTDREWSTGNYRSLADSTDTLGALTYNSGTLVPTNTTALSGRVAPAGILTDVLGNIRNQNNTTAGAFSTLLESGRLSAITVQTDSALDRITWTFDQAYQTGTFANGEPWVVGPVTITDIFPKPTDTPDIRRVSAISGPEKEQVLRTVAQPKNDVGDFPWPHGPYQDPASSIVRQGVGTVWHGSMKNPTLDGFVQAPSNGFDTRIDYMYRRNGDTSGDVAGDSGTYKNNLNVALSVCEGAPNGVTSFTLQPGDMLFSARSYVNSNPADSGKDGSYFSTCLQKIAVLTVLETAPPAGSFRPSLWGTDKTINWNTSDINWSVFKNLILPAGNVNNDTAVPYTYADMLKIMPSLPWIEWVDSPSTSQSIPTLNSSRLLGFNKSDHYVTQSNNDYPNGSWFGSGSASRGEAYDMSGAVIREEAAYGRETADKFGSVALWLNTGELTEEKKTIAYRYIQNGLDIFDWLYKYNASTPAWVKRGKTGFAPNGGHRQGRKLPVVVAAACLGAKTGAATTALKYAAGQWKAVNGVSSYEGFAEDAAVFTVNTGDLTRTINPPIGSWGGRPFATYDKSWLGKADWGITHSYAPQDDNSFQNSTYRDVQHMNSSWLACRIMGLTPLWNHDAGTVLYFERYHGPAAGAVLTATTNQDSFMYARMMPAYFSLFFVGRKIVTKQSTAVKSAASGGTTLATFPANKVGTIIAGPLSSNGSNWWQIRYKNGPTLATQLTGWSPETDINVLGSGFNTTIDGRGGIFEPGKAISLTTSVPDASVYYTTSTPGDTILTVTNSGTGAYVINSASNPTLSFVRGRRYIININAQGHPFWIQTVPGARSIAAVYNTGITGNGTAVGTITIDVPYDAPQLYYVCGNHSSMQGSITVSDSTPADYDPSSGVAKLNAGIVGTSSYELPYGDTTFSTAIVREGYDMSDVTSATYRIEPGPIPVQPSQSRGISTTTLPEVTIVDYQGVRITLAGSHNVGYYVSGEPYIVLNSATTITEINNPPNQEYNGNLGVCTATGGAMKNPIPLGTQGFCSHYVPAVDSNPDNFAYPYDSNKNIQLSLPHTVNPGDSVTVSIMRNDTAYKVPVHKIVLFMFVAVAPPAGSFRPGFYGTDRSLAFNETDIQWSRLANYSRASMNLAKIHTQSYMEDAVRFPPLPWHEWGGDTGDIAATKIRPQYNTANTNFENTAQSSAERFADAALWINLDWSQEEKRKIVIRLIQNGIDMCSFHQAGGAMKLSGSHQTGWKFPAFLAAVLLQDSRMLAITRNPNNFVEGRMTTWRITASDIQTEAAWDAAPWNGKRGRKYGNPAVFYPFKTEDIGTYWWGIQHIGGGEKDVAPGDANRDPYQHIYGLVIPSLLAARMMKAESDWGWGIAFRYMPRHLSIFSTGDGFFNEVYSVVNSTLPEISTVTVPPPTGLTVTSSDVSDLTLSNPWGHPMRYTLDGSTPTSSSQLYTVPLAIRTSTTIKAVCVPADGQDIGGVATFAISLANEIAPPTIVQTSNLSWSTSNAVSAVINQGIGSVPLSGGVKVVTSNTTQFYTISTLNTAGKLTTLTKILTVLPPPTYSPASTISHLGITWTLETPSLTGTFANGEPWVVGPVKITNIDPKPATSTADGAATGEVWNGSMINPQSNRNHGFDNRTITRVIRPTPEGDWGTNVYDPALNVALSFPFTLSAGSVLVSARSQKLTSDNDFKTPLRTVCALTVLSSPPAPGSFRPSIYGSDRTVKWNTSMMDMSVFKNYILPTGSNTPTLNSILNEGLALPWFEWAGGEDGARLQAEDNTQDVLYRTGTDGRKYYYIYGRDTATKFSKIALWLNTDQPIEDKRRVAIQLVQTGIDIYEFINNHGAHSFASNGAHKCGRKLPLVMAAKILNDSSMLAVAGNASVFQEDLQLWTVVQADVGRALESEMRLDPPVEVYTPEDVGMAEWGITHDREPFYDNRNWNATDRNNNAIGMRPSWLAARIMNLESVWNYPIAFAYSDRYNTIQPVLSGGAFINAMYNVYTALDTPLVTLSLSNTSITLGTSSTLTWATTSITRANITPDIGTVTLPTSSVVVSPLVTTTYKISAFTGTGKLATATKTLQVVPVDNPANFRSSITHKGVTWTFDKNYSTGQYVNGDWWVVGPVTIIATSPTATVGRNGMVVNQGIQVGITDSPMLNGFDNRIYYPGNEYQHNLNIAHPDRLPYTAVINSSLVKARSDPERPNGAPANSGIEPSGFIQAYEILTVVESAPSPNSFRPPYIGNGSRASKWTKDNLNYAKLNTLSKAGLTLPNKTQLETDFSNVWFEYSLTWTSRYLHTPYMAETGYGRELAIKTGDAALLLNLDYTNAEKEKLLIGVVQYGIDIAGMLDKGGRWYDTGGHNIGRLSPLIIAAGVLDDTYLKGFLNGTQKGFSEYCQTFFVALSDVGRSVYQDDRARGYPRDPYIQSDVGIADWGEAHNDNPTRDGRNWDSSYRDICGGQMTAPTIVARIMNIRSVCNWEPLFQYAVRHLEFEQSPLHYEEQYWRPRRQVNPYGNWEMPEFAFNPTPAFHQQFYNAYKSFTGLTTLTTPVPVITRSTSSLLTWSTTNATTVSISSKPLAIKFNTALSRMSIITVGPNALSGGTLTLTPQATTTYTIGVTSSDGTKSTVSTTLSVIATPTATISASISPILTGASSIIKWSTTYATSAFIDSRSITGRYENLGLVTLSGGSLTVSPSATTSYTISAFNSTGYFATACTSIGVCKDIATTLTPNQSSTSITQYGITWTFDRPYRVGQFINGDWWVVGPVIIKDIDPKTGTCGLAHGTMLNPLPGENRGEGLVTRSDFIAALGSPRGGTIFDTLCAFTPTPNASSDFFMRPRSADGAITQGLKWHAQQHLYVNGGYTSQEQQIILKLLLPRSQGFGSFDVNYSREYDSDKNISIRLPYTVPAGNSIYSVDCNPQPYGRCQLDDEGYEIQNQPNPVTGIGLYGCSRYDAEKTYFKETAVLTVLSSVPLSGSFRPPYAGSDKTIQWNISNLDYSVLRKFDIPNPSVAPRINWLEEAIKRPLLEMQFWYENSVWKASWDPSKPGGYTRRTYGREIGGLASGTGLILNSNFTNAEKEKLLIYMVQWGIDIDGLINAGMKWQPAGGHQQGRILPILIAGKVLNSSTMLSKVSGYNNFQELINHDFVQQERDINTPRTLQYDPGPIRPYTQDMLGMPEYIENDGIKTPSSAWVEGVQTDLSDGIYYDANGYRVQVGMTDAQTVAVIILMNARDDIKQEAFIRYHTERYFYRMRLLNYIAPFAGESNAIETYPANMWDAYIPRIELTASIPAATSALSANFAWKTVNIYPGNTSTITWAMSTVAYARITPGSVIAQNALSGGSITVSPSATTTYTISAVSLSGVSNTMSVTLSVLSVEAPTIYYPSLNYSFVNESALADGIYLYVKPAQDATYTLSATYAPVTQYATISGTLTNLAYNTEYSIKTLSYKLSNSVIVQSEEYYAPLTAYSEPATPTNFSIRPASSLIYVSWSAISNPLNGGFNIYYKRSSDSNYLTVIAAASSRNISINYLTGSTSYDVYIAAYNINGSVYKLSRSTLTQTVTTTPTYYSTILSLVPTHYWTFDTDLEPYHPNAWYRRFADVISPTLSTLRIGAYFDVNTGDRLLLDGSTGQGMAAENLLVGDPRPIYGGSMNRLTFEGVNPACTIALVCKAERQSSILRLQADYSGYTDGVFLEIIPVTDSTTHIRIRLRVLYGVGPTAAGVSASITIESEPILMGSTVHITTVLKKGMQSLYVNNRHYGTATADWQPLNANWFSTDTGGTGIYSLHYGSNGPGYNAVDRYRLPVDDLCIFKKELTRAQILKMTNIALAKNDQAIIDI